jgi:hypothetical protein
MQRVSLFISIQLAFEWISWQVFVQFFLIIECVCFDFWDFFDAPGFANTVVRSVHAFKITFKFQSIKMKSFLSQVRSFTDQNKLEHWEFFVFTIILFAKGKSMKQRKHYNLLGNPILTNQRCSTNIRWQIWIVITFYSLLELEREEEEISDNLDFQLSNWKKWILICIQKGEYFHRKIELKFIQ